MTAAQHYVHHAPPPISYAVADAPIWRALLSLFMLLYVLAMGLLWPWNWTHGIWLLTTLLCWLCLAHTLLRQPRGLLRWSGKVWNWTAEPGSTSRATMRNISQVQCVLDGQEWMLLAIHDAERTHWRWVSRNKRDAGSWHALRQAVFNATPVLGIRHRRLH